MKLWTRVPHTALRVAVAVRSGLVVLGLVVLVAPSVSGRDAPAIRFKKGDHVVFIGNTFIDSMRRHGHFETLLHLAYPEGDLVVRNLGWSGDSPARRLRPHGFGDIHEHLARQKADVIIAGFGMGESFGGETELATFENELKRFLRSLLSRSYNGKSPPRVVLISPIAHENLGPPLPDGKKHNRDLELYTRAMARVASDLGIVFVDLFEPTHRLMVAPVGQKMTTNGYYLDDHGHSVVSLFLGRALEIPVPTSGTDQTSEHYREVRGAVNQKNLQFFRRWRAHNGEYIYGRRASAWKIEPELEELERMILESDAGVWKAARAARGEKVAP